VNELVAALDHETQGEFREVLVQHGLERLGGMRDETVAALASLGRHPANLRRATLSVMPLGIRNELDAFRLVEPRSADGLAWKLTPLGDEAASLLAEKLPALDEATQARAKASLAERRAEIEEKLGPLE